VDKLGLTAQALLSPPGGQRNPVPGQGVESRPSMNSDTFVASAPAQGGDALIPAPQQSTAVSPLPGTPAIGKSYTGSIRIHENFHSEILGNDRNVLVYLPPGYNPASDKKYPVMYFTDGQSVFSKETSHNHIEMMVDEHAERLIKEGKMKEVIIVAVNNNDDRIAEYSHVKDPRWGGGKMDKYGDFLIKELKPYIDGAYKTSTAAKDTALVGSSLGGLTALYLGWNNACVFSNVGALSPSLWWAGKDLITRIAQDTQQKPLNKIWLDIGSEENNPDDPHGNCETVADNREMRDVLLKKGYEEGKDLAYLEEPGARHRVKDWQKRIDRVMAALFPGDSV
jgi:predicted alpha/beta superfamily hydrolase